MFVFDECAAHKRRAAIIRILADTDAGQAFPTNYVSLGETDLDLFLKARSAKIYANLARTCRLAKVERIRRDELPLVRDAQKRVPPNEITR